MRTLIVLCLLVSSSFATEADYAVPFCSALGGAKVSIPDKNGGSVTPDCITDTTAWEVDFAVNWYEAVGQAYYYAYLTGKHPGIALIVADPLHMKYVERLRATAIYWGWRCLEIRVIP